MSLYEGAKTRVIVDSEFSEELKVKVWMHQQSVLSPILIAREGALSELLYVDDLVMMNLTIEGPNEMDGGF